MKYIYIGYYTDDNVFNELLEKKVNNMSPARQKFEYNLIKGFTEILGNDIAYISYVPSSSLVEIPAYSTVHNAKINHIAINKSDIGSMNMARRQFVHFMKQYSEDEMRQLCVIMYAVNPIFMHELVKLRRKYHFKIITICSEVPKLRRGNSFASKIKKSVLSAYNEKFDGYILFSAKMVEVMRLDGKPFCVLEGIAPEITARPTPGKKNIVMYAGGLANDNNIRLLVDACKDLDALDELWICGIGPDQEYVEQIVEADKRIKYFGRIPNEQVMEMEVKAKVLVNLRSPEAGLTRYSFPSKLLEYISAGALVLSTRLDGIPDEYFQYIMTVDDLDEKNISSTLKRCFEMSEETYLQTCLSAQQFIEKEKNYIKQTQRIICFGRALLGE